MTVTAIAPSADPTPAPGKGKGKAANGADPETKGGKKKLLLIVVALVLVAGAAYWFVLKPKPASSAPVPGVVVPLDSIQVNLAGGHYLKVGIALQLVAGVKQEDGSKALDALIEEFSGLPMSQLVQPVQREKLKADLTKTLSRAYDGDVMGVYFTDFVTQ
ncbi:MAG: flagellar basal body-associated FliL family protein [Marmoricola sp.]